MADSRLRRITNAHFAAEFERRVRVPLKYFPPIQLAKAGWIEGPSWKQPNEIRQHVVTKIVGDNFCSSRERGAIKWDKIAAACTIVQPANDIVERRTKADHVAFHSPSFHDDRKLRRNDVISHHVCVRFSALHWLVEMEFAMRVSKIRLVSNIEASTTGLFFYRTDRKFLRNVFNRQECI